MKPEKTGKATSPDGMGGKLFMEYVRALRESECKYSLYENNNSIHKDIKAFISEQLGVEPIMINSALVSAQQRRRCYWTNIPGVTQPADRGIMLTDILESSEPWREKRYCMTANYHTSYQSALDKHCNTLFVINSAANKSRTIKAQYSNSCFANAVRTDGFGASMVAVSVGVGQNDKKIGQKIYSVRDKCITLSSSYGKESEKDIHKIDLPDGDYIIRKFTPIEAERLQTLPDNYTEGISKTQRYKCIGNGWTIDVISHILNGLRE